MILFLQIATGTTAIEEATDYIVANNASAIEKGVKAAFKDTLWCMGTYKNHSLGSPSRNGHYPLDVTYVNVNGDKETSKWQLRPVKLFK